MTRILAMRRRRIWMGLAVLVAALLLLAWFDAGREPQRLIVEPVAVPESYR